MPPAPSFLSILKWPRRMPSARSDDGGRGSLVCVAVLSGGAAVSSSSGRTSRAYVNRSPWDGSDGSLGRITHARHRSAKDIDSPKGSLTFVTDVRPRLDDRVFLAVVCR